MKRFIFISCLFSVSVLCSFAQTAPISIGSSINTSHEESAPIVSPDGKSLYFVRTGDPKNNGREDAADIWLSQKMPDGSWSRAVNAGAPLNNRYANRVVGIVPNGYQLYLINTYRKGKSQLALSEREGRIWSYPRKVKIDSLADNQENIDFHLNSWGNIMVISMARKDALGKRDLYVSIKKQDGTWSKPKHMGNVLNSRGEEGYVFIALDGKTLYFSSNGHKGLGGMDLFMSKRLDESWENWSTPQNLGNSINDKNDNQFISLAAAGELAFIAAQNGEQKGDIFSVRLPDEFRPEPVVLVHGRLVKLGDDLSQVLDGPQEVINLNFPQAGSPLEKRSQSFQLVVPYGEEVNLHAQVDGYYPMSPSLAFGEQQQSAAIDFDSRNILGSSNFSLNYYQREDEIKALSLQLNQMNDDITVIEESRKEIQTRLTENPNYEQGIIPPMTPSLLSIRNKYTAQLSGLPDTIPIKTTPKKNQSDKELEEMKKRFRTYYKSGSSTTNQSQSKYRNSKADEKFKRVKDSIALDLKSSLKPKVQEDLKQKWQAEVRNEVEAEVDLPSKKYLSEESQEWEKHLQNNLKGKDITPKGLPSPTLKEKADWERQLELEVKTALKPEMEEGLRRNMEADVKEALKTEATYFAKKKRAEEVEAALQQRILQQIKEEERQTERRSDIPSSYDNAIRPNRTPIYREVQQDLLLVPATVGQIITLYQIQFNPNTAQFKSKAYTELERVVLFLQENANVKVEIGGHTNGWLSHSQSMQLSKQRAQAVANYLTGHGIQEDRVNHKGYGKIKPLASNDTLEGRRKNQRIEMKIME
ncbi:MAG: OmpA family protein [Saprospiraceae bacterium]|nr:OmpA family protein [Saprospiraceae bacterium]